MTQTLRIEVSDQAWPGITAVLDAALGPCPDGLTPRDRAEKVAAQAFADVITVAAQPPTVQPLKPKIRPSRART